MINYADSVKISARFDSTIPWFVSACWLNFPARQLPAGADHKSCGLRKDHAHFPVGGRQNDIGWYSLDEGDNQQERFASYLIAAVQQATNGHCAICETMAQKRQYASLTSLFAQLFIELAEWHSHFIWSSMTII